MSEERFTYQPGVCNIDNSGVRWRKGLGYICLVVGIVSLPVMYYIHLGIIYRYILCAGFGFAGSLNLLQAKEHFCVINASARTFESSLQKTKIINDLSKDLDMKKQRNMIGKVLIYTLLAGCLGLLPF